MSRNNKMNQGHRPYDEYTRRMRREHVQLRNDLRVASIILDTPENSEAYALKLRQRAWSRKQQRASIRAGYRDPTVVMDRVERRMLAQHLNRIRRTEKLPDFVTEKPMSEEPAQEKTPGQLVYALESAVGCHSRADIEVYEKQIIEKLEMIPKMKLAIIELTVELEIEIGHRYPKEHRVQYKHVQRAYDAEMEMVHEARKLIGMEKKDVRVP